MTGNDSLHAGKLSTFRLGTTRGSKFKSSHTQIVATLATEHNGCVGLLLDIDRLSSPSGLLGK